MALTQITEKGIKDGEIINADINTSAAIAKSKLASLDIVNADVNVSAAIAGSKIDPSFTANIHITNDAPKLFLTDASNNPDFSLQNANGAFVVFDDTNSATRLEIDGNGNVLTSGNVGIGGVTSPSGPLHVYKSSGTSRSYFESGDSHTFIRLLGGSASHNSGIEFFSGSSANKANITALGAGGLQFDVGSTTAAMFINESGQFGIGTTSPNRLIHGAGASPILKLDSTNNEAYIQLKTASPSNESYIGLIDGDIYMATSGTGATSGERFRIKANGRVGINSATPSGTLSVFDPNGDNVPLVLATTASSNFIQLADSTNSHSYIGKEGSQTSFYTQNASGNATEKQAYFNSNGLNLVAGKGINFSPYDQTVTSLGSDSNMLDDYEEGSFQPNITSSATHPSQNTYVNRFGYYVKIGRLVHVNVDVQFASSGVSGGTGEAILSNLPFIKSSNAQGYGITMAVGYSPNWYNNGCPTGGYMNPSQDWLYLMPYNTNGSTFTMGADVGGGTRLIAGFSYYANL